MRTGRQYCTGVLGCVPRPGMDALGWSWPSLFVHMVCAFRSLLQACNNPNSVELSGYGVLHHVS